MKFLFLLTRKSGLTAEEFREYYETKHAPLAVKLFPFFKDYRRNYVQRDEQHDFMTDSTAETHFDVVTEMTFENKQAYQKMVDAYANPAIAKQIADDEERFVDRAKTRSLLVYEDVTSQLKLGASGK